MELMTVAQQLRRILSATLASWQEAAAELKAGRLSQNAFLRKHRKALKASFPLRNAFDAWKVASVMRSAFADKLGVGVQMAAADWLRFGLRRLAEQSRRSRVRAQRARRHGGGARLRFARLGGARWPWSRRRAFPARGARVPARRSRQGWRKWHEMWWRLVAALASRATRSAAGTTTRSPRLPRVGGHGTSLPSALRGQVAPCRGRPRLRRVERERGAHALDAAPTDLLETATRPARRHCLGLWKGHALSLAKANRAVLMWRNAEKGRALYVLKEITRAERETPASASSRRRW